MTWHLLLLMLPLAATNEHSSSGLLSISDLLAFGSDAPPALSRGSTSVVNEWETTWERSIGVTVTY